MKVRLTACVIALIALLAANFVFGWSIDYLSTSISPAASFSGESGNWTLNEPVTGGSLITFTLTYKIQQQGATAEYPVKATFSAVTNQKPEGASDAVVSGLTSCTFQNADTQCVDNVTIVAPDTPGDYEVKIDASVDKGKGLGQGTNLHVFFTVAGPSGCTQVLPTLTVGSICALYHQSTPVTLTATLTAGTTPLAGKTISFKIDGNVVGSGTTSGNGVATYSYSPAALSVGDHSITASFAGTPCQDGVEYLPVSGSGNLGLSYIFLGFQQPINADGSSAFNGNVVPVKIKITDANGDPVPDAEPYLYYAFGTPTVVGTDAEPVANTSPDGTNLMRYDATADQYILNWDVSGLANGTYTLRVDLGEGACADPHLVTLSLGKPARNTSSKK